MWIGVNTLVKFRNYRSYNSSSEMGNTYIHMKAEARKYINIIRRYGKSTSLLSTKESS